MLGLVDAVAQAVPLSSAEKYTVACIRTSNPTYLLFAEESVYPDYVVKFGHIDEMSQAYQIQLELAAILPEHIARPLTLHELSESKTMFVQQGLVGKPWFAVAAKLQSEQQWCDLGSRLTEVLYKFHQSVGTRQKWRRQLNLGEELRSKAQQYMQLTTRLPDGWNDVLRDNSRILDELGSFDCVFQHGDYSVNNTVNDGDRVGVIDFEFFGKTLMPLHDEFLLMHSLAGFAPRGCKSQSKVWSEVLETSGFSKQFEDRHVKALYLHFLIWWAIETNGKILRQKWAQTCNRALANFCQMHQQRSDWYAVTDWSTIKPPRSHNVIKGRKYHPPAMP